MNKADISGNLRQIKSTMPENVTLVAVSKTQNVDAIMEAYDAGQRIFGENKAQEMKEKYLLMPEDVQWHFIGHLQTNKIKYIISYVSLIHSIDSFNLLKEVNKEAKKCNRVVDCLLQFHIATEESKFGLSKEEAHEILSDPEFKELNNVNILGVMGMATFTDNEDEIRKEFRYLKSIFDFLKQKYFFQQRQFKEISMGMSSDYLLAIEEGSTLVRVGTAVFGERNYL